ncbi:MAG: M56 family metallopeptidase, partial [Ethanoligenens sp.]
MNFFQVNLTAAVLILVILLFRLLTISRLPKRVFLFLWAIVFCRLLLPFFVTLPAWPVENGFSAVAQKLDQIGKSILTQAKVNSVSDNLASHILLVIWLTGVAAVFLAFLFLYVLNIRKLADAIPIKNTVWLDEWLAAQKLRRPLRLLYSDRVVSPVCFGIFLPRIILPASLKLENTESLKFMLLHEMVHIRRFDAIWKLLLAVTCCAYWLNPAVWVFGYFFDRDLELSCDERVLRRFKSDKREAYANTLVGMAASV